MKSNKRTSSWYNTELPLVSPRAKILLSNPIDSRNLANAIRASRKGLNSKFTISKKSKDKINKIDGVLRKRIKKIKIKINNT